MMEFLSRISRWNDFNAQLCMPDVCLCVGNGDHSTLENSCTRCYFRHCFLRHLPRSLHVPIAVNA
jgi:hypothetical protein